MDSLEFHGAEPTRFYVLQRSTGRHVATYTTDAFFAFHTVNAYEDDGDGHSEGGVGNSNTNANDSAISIVVDICAYDNTDVLQELKLKNIRDYRRLKVPTNSYRRFRLLGAGQYRHGDRTMPGRYPPRGLCVNE